MGCCESCFRYSSESVPEKEQYRLIPDCEENGATSSLSSPAQTKVVLEDLHCADQESDIVQNSPSYDLTSWINTERKASGNVIDSPKQDATNTYLESTSLQRTEMIEASMIATEDAHQIIVTPYRASNEDPVVCATAHNAGNAMSEVCLKAMGEVENEVEGNGADFTSLSTSTRPKPSVASTVLDLLHNQMSAVERHKIYGREFRLFLPCIDEDTDATWLSGDLMRTYKESLDTVRQLTRQAAGATPEIREDTYVIGQPYFGLKYRSQNKLEMKVRTENRPVYLEKWSKVKFGKKKIPFYKQDILTYLSDMGFAEDCETNRAILENPKFLSILKSRSSVVTHNVSIEVCEITIPDRQHLGVSTTASFSSKKGATQVSATISDVKRKKWLSVAVEGLNTDIEQFVSAQHKQSELLKCLAVLRQIYATHTSAAIDHGLVPVVSGYPHWVRVVAGNRVNVADNNKTSLHSTAVSPPVSNVGSDVMEGVDALLRFVEG